MAIEVSKIREHFPALGVTDDHRPRVYLDNPAGTQVAREVLERTTRYLTETNANHGGVFRTAVASDRIVAEARQAMAEFLNARSPREIVFGPNMTTLTYSLSRALGRGFESGERLILTRMDHDANVHPWMQLAQDRGMEVLWLDFSPESYEFDLEDLQRLLSRGVRLVAVNYASNALGTVNDVRTICRMARETGALTYIDAVQFAPHGPIDVQKLGCDFLVCSAYKFFAGHLGILWGREELLESLTAYQVRPAGTHPPAKFETGTQSHETIAGLLGAMDYFAGVGGSMAQEFQESFRNLPGRAPLYHAAMVAIREYEKPLSARLIAGLQAIPGVKIHGISSAQRLDRRVPTVAMTLKGVAPAEVARRLAADNIFVWDGHYYAVEVVRRLGLADCGGMVRIGPVHYNTVQEIDTVVAAVAKMAAGE